MYLCVGELKHNSYVITAGDVWKRPGCIPMVAAFPPSPLTCIAKGGCTFIGSCSATFGQLQIDGSGFVFWITPSESSHCASFGILFLLATSFPNSPRIAIVSRICRILRPQHGRTLFSGSRRTEAMRVLHRAVAKANPGSPHASQATIKVLHHLSYKMLLKRGLVAVHVGAWIRNHACGSADRYSSWVLPPALRVNGICGA